MSIATGAPGSEPARSEHTNGATRAPAEPARGDDGGAQRAHGSTSGATRAERVDSITTEVTTHPRENDLLSRNLWRLQAGLWEFSDLKRLRGCHRWLAPGAGGAGIHWAPGQARWGHVQNSHSVWASPLAATRIARLRAEEVSKAADNWLASKPASQQANRGIEFLTLTLRHHRGQSLSEVWDTIAYCWQATTRGASWHGSAKVQGDKHTYGIAHYIKSVEVTHGANGWHVHLHVLLLCHRRLTETERAALSSRMFLRWSNAAVRKGFEAPEERYGINLKEAVTDQNTAKLGAYLTKGQTSKLANELTGGIASKQARGENRTPFQVLLDMCDARDSGDDYSADLAIWREWETSSSGRRQMAWSKGAKQELGVIDLDDEEILAKDDAENFPDPYSVAMVERENWHRVAPGRSRKLCDDVELRGEILREVRKAKTPEEAQKRAEKILKTLGIEFISQLTRVEYVALSSNEKLRIESMKASQQTEKFANLLASILKSA